MSTVPMRERLLALGLLVLVLAGLAGGIALAAIRLHRHYDAAAADRIDRLQRFTRMAATRNQIEASIVEAERAALPNHLFGSDSATKLAADLQSAATAVVERLGGRLISSQVPQLSAPAKGEDLTRASIALQLNASAPALQLILHGIENHEPFLFLDQLTIRSNQGRTARVTPGVEPEFNVQITVTGLARLGAAS